MLELSLTAPNLLWSSNEIAQVKKAFERGSVIDEKMKKITVYLLNSQLLHNNLVLHLHQRV